MSKEQKSKVNWPKSGYTLFLKLYCKRRNMSKTSKDNTLQEAFKSWITLTDEEKQKFIVKYSECKINEKNKFAGYLKKTEPYLKKKIFINRIPVTDNNQKDSELPNPNGEDKNVIKLSNVSQLEDVNVLENICPSMQTHIENVSWSPASNLPDSVHNNISVNDMPDVYPEEVLPEPAPLQIRNSMELFELIKAKLGAPDLSWSSLTSTEKQFYQKAVYQLKKDYIRNYKAYLESLPSKELFIYYHKNIY